MRAPPFATGYSERVSFCPSPLQTKPLRDPSNQRRFCMKLAGMCPHPVLPSHALPLQYALNGIWDSNMSDNIREKLWYIGKKAGLQPKALVSSPNSDTNLPCATGQLI